jgi:hypothetical protein
VTNIIEGIQTQCNRCRVIVGHYEQLGPVGVFGKVMIERDIAEGEAAIASGDVVRMVRAYKALEEVKE